MQRSRLRNIINKSKEVKSQVVDTPFNEFKKSLPIQVDDNYRLEAAWKAYGSPKDYKTALWNGLIQPIDENNYKLPSIGYNEETEEYEYLNKGRDNEIVNKDIRVWDNDVIPLVQELKLGGYVRSFNEEKDCWTYTKNSQKRKDPAETDEQQVTEQFQKGGNISRKTSRDINDLIEEGIRINPRFIQRLFEEPKAVEFTNENGNLARGSHLLSYFTSDGKDIVYPTIQEDENGNLIYIQNQDEAIGKAIRNKDILILPNGEGEYFTTQYKNANKIKPWFDKWSEKFGDYSVPLFKNGGQMSVIPEGALHSRKNNMKGAGEDFTAKGIPVISNDGEQVAEIEKNEIVFNKEVTDFIEENYKKFHSDKVNSSEKDELAIKVGKRLVKEIFENTDDRTGLIKEVADKNNLEYNNDRSKEKS